MLNEYFYNLTNISSSNGKNLMEYTINFIFAGAEINLKLLFQVEFFKMTNIHVCQKFN